MLERRLIFVSGKGGVGKSAVAAGLALAAVRQGRRVLAISMVGDGGGLTAHLGGPPLEFDAQEIRPGLSALRIDRSKALIEYLVVQAGVPAIAAFGPIARAFDSLASAAPAIREIVTIGKVLWEAKQDTWDLVVADGPPTGQMGSYLTAPATISELVPTGRIREQVSWMKRNLGDPEHCGLVLVSLAEELPVTETLETAAWLQEADIVPPPLVVANRVLSPLKLPTSIPAGPIGDAARLHSSLHEEQTRWMARLDPERELPFQFGVFTAPEVAAHLADEVETW